ncbi:Arginine repressor [Lactobacillus equicursoris DSM 19284 = JCM 14600 = CIP 110162]|uniref:Arginine repressor n=3 Tax=Lactobacillus equicursoris TaxID=420645 RepID=K0NJZ3_9LACO|nr:arginine repressor [Lactobacillus equicursoris]KRL03348.1 arginine repressor, C-terminal domain protein [Lactobacillus equicursoris DSM 19284 = JCM 14600 = CIP 110162]MDD6387018.1 arginine repressor [Lactobacillus equicursoris]MDD6406628.1 arginine repressor [Lactobacillus equicursoris]MST80197.1 arginine repressor [Lactobacillus equicursoris]CCK83136.1 Arginine repressor [Lactobacillus equicursoris 66c]
MNYKERRQLIYELIQTNKIETQEQLLLLLKTHGATATQATISRDIHALHISKVPDDDGRSYYVKAPSAAVNRERQLREAIRDRVATVTAVQFTVVIQTSMKLTYAPILAGLIDDVENDDIAGTIAGTDTLLVIMKNNEAAQEFADWADAIVKDRKVY